MKLLYRFLALTHVLALCFFLQSCDTTNGSEDKKEPFDAGPILFISDESGSYQLYSMNEDGSDVKQLTDDPDFPITDARWSPDGTRIAFTSYTGGPRGYDQVIYVMNADGSGLRRVTAQTGQRPVWSPDSRKIAYSKSTGFEGTSTETFIVNADGTNEKQITGWNNMSESVTDWSADGQLLPIDVFGGEGGIISMMFERCPLTGLIKQ